MNDMDELLDSVLTERGVPKVGADSAAAVDGTPPSPAPRSVSTGSGRDGGVDGSVGQSADGGGDAEVAIGNTGQEVGLTSRLDESGEIVPVNENRDRPATVSPEKQQPARRGMARQRERSGRCPMYAPAGTKCKTCGKVHPL